VAADSGLSSGTDIGARGTELLQALAASDLDSVRRMCAERIVMYGTDTGERWDDLESLCVALDEMRSLGLTARWAEPPACGENWLAGLAIYRSDDGPPVLTRVSIVFENGLAVHGHFSLEGTMPVGQ
jgi:hypothetical protein